MSVSKSRFTVAKLDAGMAILLTSDHHLIEFPSLLLPSGVAAGSIIDLSVAQNAKKEEEEREAFLALQKDIHSLFGVHNPSTPELSVRNITQTSVVLEWNLLDLATADMRSLSLYKNGSKLGKIPNATTTTTKLSGLALDTTYTFHLVLRTSAGTFRSNALEVKTHKMTNLSGLNICVSNIKPEERERVTQILARIGAKPPHDKVRIDTTHFVTNRGMGDEYKKAQTMNVPIVVADFVEDCEAEGRIMRVGSYYLDSDPALRPKRAAPAERPARTPDAAPATADTATIPPVSDVLPRQTTPATQVPESVATENKERTTSQEESHLAEGGAQSQDAVANSTQDPQEAVGSELDAAARGPPTQAEAAPIAQTDDATETVTSRSAVVEPLPEAAVAVEDLPAQAQEAESAVEAGSFPPSMGRGTPVGELEDVAL